MTDAVNDVAAIVDGERGAYAQFDPHLVFPDLVRIPADDVLRAFAAAAIEWHARGAATASREDVIVIAVPATVFASASRASASGPGELLRPRRVTASHYRFSGWTLRVREKQLEAPGGGIARLRKAELALLAALLEHPRQAVRRADLARWVRRAGRSPPSDRAVDSYVCRLRARFLHAGGSRLITSVHAVGYRLDSDVHRA